MRSIWKFPLSVKRFTTISMPKGAEILTVQIQNGDPCLWAIVETDAKMEERQIHVFGTGDQFNLVDWEYIGTVQQHSGHLVLHIFETPFNHAVK